MSELYDRIDKICKARGTNITTICKKAGVGRATLSELNAGRTKTLTLETIRKLADALQVSINFLTGDFSDGTPIEFTVSTDELRDYIAKKQKSPTSVSERGPARNVIKIAGRDGSFVERKLIDEQVALMKNMLDQLRPIDDDRI